MSEDMLNELKNITRFLKIIMGILLFKIIMDLVYYLSKEDGIAILLGVVGVGVIIYLLIKTTTDANKELNSGKDIEEEEAEELEEAPKKKTTKKTTKKKSAKKSKKKTEEDDIE